MQDYTPLELATKRRKLALEYKEKKKEMAEIQKKKAIELIKLTAEHKTVAKANLYWNASELGQKEIELKYYTDGLLELMRSIKSEIDMKSAEAFGQY